MRQLPSLHPRIPEVLPTPAPRLRLRRGLPRLGGAHRHQLCPAAVGAGVFRAGSGLGAGREDRALDLQRPQRDAGGKAVVPGCLAAGAAVHHPGGGAVRAVLRDGEGGALGDPAAGWPADGDRRAVGAEAGRGARGGRGRVVDDDADDQRRRASADAALPQAGGREAFGGDPAG